jgi:dephospho-CoA kinase
VTIASRADPAHPCIIIGLTGGIGSGKSTVADLFAAQGAGIVDTDQIAHALTSPGGAAMPAICATFGPAMQTPGGALDRAAMRALIFSEPARRAELEAILHPMIRTAAQRALSACPAPYTLLIVPLLVETGHYLPCCTRILVVDCPEEIQIARVMARSGLSQIDARRIIATQASREARLAIADDIIDNSASPATLPERVSALHHAYMQITARRNQIS